MNRERVQLWVDALRSGEYVQGADYLRDSGKHCCLGVAMEVALKHGAVLPPHHFVSWGKEVMNDWAADWYEGLENDPTLILADGREQAASHCNDVLGLTFAEIADGIERTFLNPEHIEGEQS